jgi:regulatory protein
VIITALQRTPRRRGRVDVYVDGVRRLELARNFAAERHLRPGHTLDEAQLAALGAEDARRQALRAAAALLARRPHSEREIRLRLRRRRFEPALIERAVGRLRHLGLIDDAEFARAWAQSRDRVSPRARRLITGELRALGVCADAASRAAEPVDDEDAAYRLASRRLRACAAPDYARFRSRLAGMLQRRGFSFEVTRATVDRCWRETHGEAAPDDAGAAVE